MKEEKIPCRIIRYREFPDLLFGTLREDGPVYFDATRFIQAKGDARRHNVRDFRVAFHHWATALADAYGIDREKMIIRDEASGHLLIDECLALLFVVYIDPAFGVYLLERVDELLSGGFTVSDTWLVQASSFLLVIRLTFVFKQGSLMCHLAHRIVRAFLAAKGVIIFQHQCAEVGQLDFHIRMQMPEIESAAAYILARATE